MADELFIRLYLDHNVHTWIATTLQRDGYDVIFAAEVGNAELADDEQLRWATRNRRVIFTYDRLDYPRLARAFAERDETHAGIVISLAPPMLTSAEIVSRLRRFLNTVAADEMRNQVRWLDPLP